MNEMLHEKLDPNKNWIAALLECVHIDADADILDGFMANKQQCNYNTMISSI